MPDKFQIKLKCKECGEILEPDAQFCHGCGVRVAPATCDCGFQLPEQAKFCPECGKPVGSGAVAGNSSSTLTDSFTGMEFVFVKGGTFQMGDTFGDGYQWEQPVHEVVLDDFCIGKYPVTQGQWEKVMGDNPSHFQLGSNHPVENVSWDDEQEFIKKLNQQSNRQYRLPTEAEWEYAARSGGRKDKWAGTSQESELEDYAWYDINSGGTTHPVGLKKPNGLGIYDMSGNVFERCSDCYDDEYYSRSACRNPPGASSGSLRVSRGGSCGNGAKIARAALRLNSAPGIRDGYCGFRLVFLPVQ